MKTLTIRQPHVAAIFAGLKRYEIRSWKTTYRGPLLIHAAGSYDYVAIEDVLGSSRHRRALGIGNERGVAHAARNLPMSAVVGMVELVDIVPTEDVPRRGRGWGSFPPEHFAWRLTQPRALHRPFRVSGRLGLWEADLPTVLLTALRKQLA